MWGGLGENVLSFCGSRDSFKAIQDKNSLREEKLQDKDMWRRERGDESVRIWKSIWKDVSNSALNIILTGEQETEQDTKKVGDTGLASG